MPTTLLRAPPRIFRPSYGPVKGLSNTSSGLVLLLSRLDALKTSCNLCISTTFLLKRADINSFHLNRTNG